MDSILTKVRDSPLLGSPLGRQRTRSALVGVAALAGVIAIDELAVRALSDTTYLELYLTYGALANLVIVVFTLAWSDQLERHASLISAHPIEYLGGHVYVGSMLWAALSAAVSPGHRQYREMLDTQARAVESAPGVARLAHEAAAIAQRDDPTGTNPLNTALAAINEEMAASVEKQARAWRDLPWVPIGLGFLDHVITMAIALVLSLGLLAWTALVVPAQYFVYVIAGAPAREALSSPQRVWLKVTRGAIEFDKTPKVRGIPDGASESGISTKPVTLTAALAAIMLFALSRLLT
jgi:hypothetical protein